MGVCATLQFNKLAAPVMCQATSEKAETRTQLSAEWYWLWGLCDHLVAGSGLGALSGPRSSQELYPTRRLDASAQKGSDLPKVTQLLSSRAGCEEAAKRESFTATPVSGCECRPRGCGFGLLAMAVETTPQPRGLEIRPRSLC